MVEGSSRGEAEDALGEGQGKREERKRLNREAGRSHEGEPREPGAGKGCKHVPFWGKNVGVTHRHRTS